jgi:hypothetical protein
LCGSIEALVNLIVTLPAVAVSDDFTNFKPPLGSAACASALPPAAGALVAAELVDGEEAEVVGLLEVELWAAAEVLLALLVLLLLDPPHAARPRTSAVALSATAGNLITVGFSLQGGSGTGTAQTGRGTKPGSALKTFLERIPSVTAHTLDRRVRSLV